ncbi:MAG: DUF748 domain-containing protein [Rhodocyclales bacterium]|nr:DUF748 domain-containing protein [Rhodocyclales bacterium]
MFKKIDPAALARHPRTRKWGLRVAIFLAVVGLLGFFAAPPLIKSILVGKLGEALHREVAVESVSLNPYTMTATIRGLSVRDKAVDGATDKTGEELFGFDSLRVNAELGSIAVAGVVVKEIELLGPRLRVTRFPDKRYNFSDLLDEWMAKPKEEGSDSPPRFSVSNIQISGGKLEFDDRLEGVNHAVTDLTLRLPFVSSLSFYADTYVEPHFSATINGAPLVLTGKSRPFAESHESELALDLDNLQLARYFAYLPVEMPIRIDSGAIDSELRLRFVQAKDQPAALTLAGSVALKDFKVSETNGSPLFAMKRLDVGLREVDLVKLAVGIERISLVAPEVDARIDQNGQLNWLALIPPASGPRTAPAAEKSGKEAAPLRLTIDQVQLKGGALRLHDRSTGSEQRVALRDVQVDAAGFDSGGGKPLSLSLGWKLDGGTQAQIEEIAVRQGSLDLKKRELRIGEYAMRGMRLNVARARDGSLAFLRAPALKSATTAGGRPAEAAPAASGSGKEAPWRVTVDQVNLSDHVVRFEDNTFSPAAVQTIELASLAVSNLSTVPDAEAQLTAKLRFNKKGEAEIAGKLRPLQSQGTLQLALREIELLPLQPYFGEMLNLTVTRGVVTAKGEVGIAPAKEGVSVGYKGDLTLGDFHSVDKINSANFLRWKSFHFGEIDVVSNPPAVAIGEVALSDFFARVIVSPEGKLNLMQIVRTKEGGEPAKSEAAVGGKSAETPAPEAPVVKSESDGRTVAQLPPKPPKAVIPVKIGKVTLQGGRINFSDNFVKPNYSANLTKVGGRVTGLSSTAGTMADLELRGTYNDLAPLNITAKLNPFAAKRYLDLDAEVKGVELTGFSPYSGKYAGYAIEKGKLSLFLKYRIDDNQLVAENRVFLDQLTFGEPVESPTATKLPVTLAVSLLKNRAGEIDINLPIAGSLDDPEFSVGGIIVKVIANLFVKAVTSPFALLGSLFGGGEELAYVEFDNGYASVAGPMLERMKSLAKALEDRPGLKIELAGRIDPDNDREGLKKAMMERRVKAQRLEELVKQGTEAGSADDVVIAEKDYPRYLEKAYKAEKFPKPRNIVGLLKDLPVEEMEKLMLANMKADDEALRRLADRRARNVAQWLTTEGKVESERVFILQPNLTPTEGPQQDKAKGSRVDFSLK